MTVPMTEGVSEISDEKAALYVESQTTYFLFPLFPNCKHFFIYDFNVYAVNGSI